MSEQLSTDISAACRTYLPDIAKAAEWLRRNKVLFRSVVIEPDALQMTEEQILQFIEEKENGYWSADRFPRPTSFRFRDPDDFDVFLDNVRFEQDLKIDCEMLM